MFDVTFTVSFNIIHLICYLSLIAYFVVLGFLFYDIFKYSRKHLSILQFIELSVLLFTYPIAIVHNNFFHVPFYSIIHERISKLR